MTLYKNNHFIISIYIGQESKVGSVERLWLRASGMVIGRWQLEQWGPGAAGGWLGLSLFVYLQGFLPGCGLLWASPQNGNLRAVRLVTWWPSTPAECSIEPSRSCITFNELALGISWCYFSH